MQLFRIYLLGGKEKNRTKPFARFIYNPNELPIVVIQTTLAVE